STNTGFSSIPAGTGGDGPSMLTPLYPHSRCDIIAPETEPLTARYYRRFRRHELWEIAMKHLALLSVLFVPILTTPVAAADSDTLLSDRPATNVQMIYAVNPAAECFRTARDAVDLSFGLEHCNIAMHDPLLNYRAETIVNRGIIRYDLGDHDGALRDFDRALEINPAFGNAYLNQAQVLVAEKRPDEAMAAINQGIALGATNLQVAYYTRGE